MKLRKHLPWYYWIPLIGMLPVIFSDYKTTDEDRDEDKIWTTWYFEYQVTLMIVVMAADIAFEIFVLTHY